MSKAEEIYKLLITKNPYNHIIETLNDEERENLRKLLEKTHSNSYAISYLGPNLRQGTCYDIYLKREEKNHATINLIKPVSFDNGSWIIDPRFKN